MRRPQAGAAVFFAALGGAAVYAAVRTAMEGAWLHALLQGLSGAVALFMAWATWRFGP
jgi:hypothetical protein